MPGVSSPGRRAKRVLLADVAREAGVSVQTASHVMSGNMTVRLPDSTRERVYQAAERVGYRPNRLAQAMKRGRTNLIGVWMPVDRLVFTYLRFLRAISSHSREDGFELMITGLEGATAYSGRGSAPSFWPIDGLIAVDAGKAIQLFRADPSNDGIPVVVLGFEEFANSDSVTWDVAGAARLATERLIEKGCRKIVHITLDWILADYPREQRRRGYTEAMTSAGLEPRFVAAPDETSAGAAQAIAAHLVAEGCPDAVVGFTDTLAIGATRAVLEAGFDVPGDCRIWGFGDYPESGEVRIPLSTIRVPVEEAVAQAWKWIIQRMGDPDTAHRMATLDMELIERESS